MIQLPVSILLFISLITGTSLSVAAQKDTGLKIIKTITGDIIDFTTDNLGNVYLINQYQQIKKLNNTFDSVGIFNNVRQYGKLHSIDATNPLKIILYYKAFATIVLLDRFLNVRNTIQLRQAGIFQCQLVGQSFDNNIWLFDELDYKIKKIDDSGKQLLETPDFRVLFDAPPHPTQIEDYNKFLYVYDSAKGLSIFDYYGALKNQVSLKYLKDVQGYAKGIIARDSMGLVYYEPSSIQTTYQQLVPSIRTALKIKVVGNKLFAMPQAGMIVVYEFP